MIIDNQLLGDALEVERKVIEFYYSNLFYIEKFLILVVYMHHK